VVADLRIGVNSVGAASSRDLAFIAISSPGCLLSNNREQHPTATKVPRKEAVILTAQVTVPL
jgi:hypothetical protein